MVDRDHELSSDADAVRGRHPVATGNLPVDEPGERLDSGARTRVERVLGRRFEDVRIHRGHRAAKAMAGIGADAATYDRHVVFGRDAYQPASPDGLRLIAHELAHVAQQDRSAPRRGIPLDAAEAEARASALDPAQVRARIPEHGWIAGGPRIQAQGKKKAPARAAQPVGVTLTFVLRAPDDEYTKDVVAYTKNTLGREVIEVDNLEEVIAHLRQRQAANAPKVGQIRLIGHGTSTGDIKMTPQGEAGRRWVTAAEIEQVAASKNLQATAASVMEDGASVEFLGCYIGDSPKTTGALSELFQADVRATSETLKTGYHEFARPPEGEERERVTVTSSAEIDARAESNPNLKKGFDRWLLDRYRELIANGDMSPRAKRADQLAAMREVFDRSGGRIRQLMIEGPRGDVVKRDKKRWMGSWKRTTFKRGAP